MRYALAPLALLAATPAHADAFTEREIVFQVLNAADVITTVDCLNRKVCHESNPLFGKNPSTEKLVAVKLGTGALHWFIADRIRRSDPNAAKWFQIATIAIQGGVVAANLRFTF